MCYKINNILGISLWKYTMHTAQFSYITTQTSVSSFDTNKSLKHQLPSTFPEEDDNQDQKRETSGTNPKQNRKADHTVEIDGRGDSDRKQELKGNNSKR